MYVITECGNFISEVEQHGYYKLAYKWKPYNFLLGTHLVYFFTGEPSPNVKVFSLYVYVYNFSTGGMIIR
jgi:hypothetical protein